MLKSEQKTSIKHLAVLHQCHRVPVLGSHNLDYKEVIRFVFDVKIVLCQ